MRFAAITAFAIGVSLFAAPVSAASGAELESLRAALGIERLLEIMREEGLEQSDDLREDLFAGRGGRSWSAVVSGIYDLSKMEAGRGAFTRMERDASDRVSLLQEFAEINDLVEFNVMGAMNGSLAFMKGLSKGGGFEISEADILADIWAREEEIRADTTGWIFAYLGMAYQPLEADQIRAYSELSATAVGQDLNRALFAGFDAMFNEISFALGRSASRFMVGEDL